MMGPILVPIPNEAERMPAKAGRLCGLTLKAMTVKHPPKMPAAPTPVIARPTMTVVLFGATPWADD
jgi:hypothetical protein